MGRGPLPRLLRRVGVDELVHLALGAGSVLGDLRGVLLPPGAHVGLCLGDGGPDLVSLLLLGDYGGGFIVARARAGEGPTLIEALTYRFRGHSLADPDEMRAKAEKEFWFARDPIKKLAGYLTEQNLAAQEELKAIDRKIQQVIDEAVKFAESSPEPDPSELYRFVFAEDK